MLRLSFFRDPATAFIMAWVVFLVYLSSTPRLLLIPSFPRPLMSAAAHLVAYFILSSLIYMVLRRNRPGPIGGLRSAVRAMAIAIAIGIVVEAMQGILPDRSAHLLDVGLNIAGVLSGLAVVVLLNAIGLPRHFIFAAIGLAIALIVLGTTASTAIWDPNYPYAGDHWHSVYAISVCGVRQPNLPGARGGVHLHGDEYIHIHPQDASEEGENATLSHAFRTSGAEITSTSLSLPWGVAYRNGDVCPDGFTGELVIFADGERVDDPATYVLKDRQTIIIMFRTTGFRDQV